MTLTAQQYMKECEPIRASCVKCGIPMASPYCEFGNKLSDEFYCGNCGICFYKTCLGEWKWAQLKIQQDGEVN